MPLKPNLALLLLSSSLLLFSCGDGRRASKAENSESPKPLQQADGGLMASPERRMEVRADTIDKFFEMTEDGKLKQPKEYREWVYVGTPLTPNSLNPPAAPFPEFHNVYIDPVSWKVYKDSGQFRDGTIIIKELVTVGSEKAVSGNGYFMGDYVGLEATIKSAEYFPNEPGNWAYFSFGHSYPLAETAEAFPTQSCNTCHESSAATDFVFTQYYPVLRARSASVVQGQELMDHKERTELMAAMTAATGAIDQPRAQAGTSPGPVPTDPEALFKYLQNREYESFKHQETGVHPSAGPHTKFGTPVRVFYSDEVAKSLSENRAEHPVGSSIVKEIYENDGTTLMGWAVSVKTAPDSAGGDGWFWYEVTSTKDASQLAVQPGNGIPMCAGCHSAGKDFVLSRYSPE